VFTSENALNGSYLDSEFKLNPHLQGTYHKLKGQIEDLPSADQDGGKSIQKFVSQYMAKRYETHQQSLPKTFGPESKRRNVYSYIRSKDGFGHECNVMAVPINTKPSVVYLLTFIEMMYLKKPNWQSMDLILLFYQNSDYSLSVKEFLDGYFADTNTESSAKESIWAQSQSIKGRCGYIR